jgi:LytS/YehU family sensor histidine kinase
MTCRLSEFLRISLAADGVQEVTLASELEHLQSYVEIQRLRFRGRFDVRLEIEPEALAGLMPSLLLQPLVENVVKHGVASRAEPTHALIRAGRRGGRLRLEIEDDGPGLAAGPPAAGIGLANTRARLAKLYGGDQRFELENRAAGGLLVVVELPWQEVDAAPRPATFGALPPSFQEGAPGSRRGSCAFSVSALESPRPTAFQSFESAAPDF